MYSKESQKELHVFDVPNISPFLCNLTPHLHLIGPETAPTSAADAAIAVTVSEMKAAASSAASVDTNREIAVVAAVTVVAVADQVAAMAPVAAATTHTTRADAEVVVTIAVAPTGITEEALAVATHQMIAVAVVALTET